MIVRLLVWRAPQGDMKINLPIPRRLADTLDPMKSTLTILIVIAVGLLGCVEREITITSEPEGALVYVSDVEVGRTPVTFPFTWYGDYDIILRKEGYETLKTNEQISMPWYEVPPADLFSELAPWLYLDERFFHYELETYQPLSQEELLQRAEEMRQYNIESVED
jgi:hypothetical protein